MEVDALCQRPVTLRNGCSPVQLAFPTGVCAGPFQDTTHLHPSIIGPATDTSVTLTISNGQKTLCLKADLHDMIHQIKERIMQERKFGWGSISLLYRNQELRDSETLEQQNVKHQATLLIVHKCSGG